MILAKWSKTRSSISGIQSSEKLAKVQKIKSQKNRDDHLDSKSVRGRNSERVSQQIAKRATSRNTTPMRLVSTEGNRLTLTSYHKFVGTSKKKTMTTKKLNQKDESHQNFGMKHLINFQLREIQKESIVQLPKNLRHQEPSSADLSKLQHKLVSRKSRQNTQKRSLNPLQFRTRRLINNRVL